MTKAVLETLTKTSLDSVLRTAIRVLLVDDEIGFLKVAKQVLGMQGAFQVETASSVEKAMEKMKAKTYDVIVSDYKMPEKDGLEFLKELRDNGNDTPFIMFTGKGREEVAIKALNLGADLYFNKIGDPETVYGELAHGIRKSVERKRAYMEALRREERIRAVLASSPDAIIISDLQGNVVDCNQATLKLTGYASKEEIIGRNSLEFIAEKDRDRALENLKKTLEQGTLKNIEYTLLKANGEEYQGELSASFLKDASSNPIGFVGVVRGITKRKKTEEELRNTKNYLNNLLNYANAPIIVWDNKKRITLFNDAFEAFTGYKKESVLGRNIDVLFPPLRKQEILQTIEKATKGEKWKSIEIPILCKDKETKIALWNSANITDREGKMVATIAQGQGITERKNMEEALKVSEEKYRNIVELAPDGIITVNTKGVTTSVNNAFLRLTGYSRDEVVGIHFTKLGTLRARDIPKYLRLMSSVMRGKIPEPFEYSYVRKSGAIGWGEAHVGLMKKDGKTAAFQVLLRDITGRKMAVRATQESEEKFERLFMDNPEAAIYTDSKFHLLDVNPRFKELFGYSLDEIKGKHIDDIIVPKDKTREAKTLNKKAKKGYVYHNTVRQKKNGSLVPVSISAAPITVEDQLIGYVAVYKDISQLKETLEKMEIMNEKLRVVGNLTRHDARNKLSIVTMNTFLTKQKLDDDHEVLEQLSAIESAIEQVERIFDFAGNYEKLGIEQLFYINLEKTVEEAISLHSELQDVKIINDCHDLMVMADSLLRQLFYNLIHNSLEHGKKVNRIRVHYELEKDQLKLFYEDDGVGIPKDKKEEIFESGHGLKLVRKICEVYGWIVRETGKPSKGAQFTVTIPKTSVRFAPQPANQTSYSHPKSKQGAHPPKS